jgi:hypothetical protein
VTPVLCSRIGAAHILLASLIIIALASTTLGQPEVAPAASEAAEQLGAPPNLRGVALGLFADDPSHDYTPQLEEIADLGASHVAVVVTYFQQDIYATKIFADPRRTPSQETITRTLRTARRLGLETMLFPYVRVDRKLEPSHWRGTLQPSDRAAWFEEYERWILTMARIAASTNVGILSLGSEMSTVDVDEQEWWAIIARAREVYSGQITYSSNWDHYERVAFWDALDFIGLTGYFELVPPTEDDPSLEAIIEGWREWHVRLMRWQRRHDRPLLMTEVGYRSNNGAAAFPWRWGEEENQVDLEEQRRAYLAYARIWSDEPRLGGVFFWNWWGEGGPECHDYTPRRKPAEGVLREWFGAAVEPDGSPR